MDQIGALHAQRPQVGDHVAQLGGFVLDGLLEVGEAGAGLFGRRGYPATQNVQLDLDAQERLQNPIVKVARDAAALAFDGARAQVTQQKNIFDRRPYVPRYSFKPYQVLAPESPPTIR